MMETKGALSSNYTIIKQQDVFMVFSKRTLESFDAFRHSVEKLHNTCITQLVSSIVFGISEQNSNKESYDLLVWPFILCLT